jgi:Fe-S oxidoreductase
MITENMQEIINKNRAGYCLECGKCTAVCPISRWGVCGYASSRLLVEKAIEGQMGSVIEDDLFWSCLTCKRCSEICPSEVSFSEFMRDLRALAWARGHSGVCTHSGVIHNWSRMMTQADLRQNRLGWLTDDLKVSKQSETLYFAGCLPFYDSLFSASGYEGVRIAQAALKIMNHLGIEPQVLSDERCCGHDQLWQGDNMTFRALAELNLEQFEKLGIKRIITTCPECALTLKVDYPRLMGSHNLEVLHLTELLARSELFLPKMAAGNPGLSNPKGSDDEPIVTYQDPCRLGRHMGVYEAPREVLAGMGLRVTEMAHNRQSSLCCGTSCWTSCGAVSKNIQVERLREAKATGAGLLVTTCHKCQIHFKCAQSDPALGEQIGIEIRDLTTLVAERLL